MKTLADFDNQVKGSKIIDLPIVKRENKRPIIIDPNIARNDEKRPIKIDPRVAKQDAKSAVRDPLDAFIELITNCIDSYNRLKSRGEQLPKDIDGKIELQLLRKTRGKEKVAIISCKDWAEGIAPDKLEEYISGYGSKTSGKDTFQSIRGFFGRGLKDAAAGLDGIGTIHTVKDGVISIGKIDGRDKNAITFSPVTTEKSTKENLKKYYLTDGAKTLTSVTFSTRDKQVPLFSTFAEKLIKCVPLRPLMVKGTIKLVQMERGKVIKEQILRYNLPNGVRVLDKKDNPIPNEKATYSIIIYKTDESLTQSELGKFREGGLLIMSGSSVHEATLLKYDTDPNASKFFGAVKCDYIDELMKNDEHVVTPSRRGLNWDHAFMKKLKVEVENQLKPFIDEEKEEKDRKVKGTSEEVLKRNLSLGRKLGQLYREIIKDEGLASLEGSEPSDDEKDLQIPRFGFGFIPDFYTVEPKKMQKVRLVIESPKIISDSEKVTFESTKGSITLEKKQIAISEGNHIQEKGVYIIRNGITGLKEGDDGEIIAKTKDKRGIDSITKAHIVVKTHEVAVIDKMTFFPSSYRIKVEKPTKIVLKINSEAIPKGVQKINLSSNNNYIVLEQNEIPVPECHGIAEEHVIIRGTRVGETGKIIASFGKDSSIKCEADIKVVSENPSASPKGFKIEFDPDEFPIQRAFCKGNEIFVFINEPTVKKYYGENGEYAKSLSFAVLCADLITDAFCTKVTQDISEKLAFPGEDKETAMRNKLNEYKKRYGPIIHNVYVEKELLESERALLLERD
jgi:hypothetical protein